MILLLVLLQSALPPATSQTEETTRTDRFEFEWSWSSQSSSEDETRSEFERANEDRPARATGWVEISPGVYEFRALEPAPTDEDDWGFREYNSLRSRSAGNGPRPANGSSAAQGIGFGNCTPEEYRRRRAAADSMGIERTGCEIDTDAAREAVQEAEAENDTPRWSGRVELAPEDTED